MIRHALKWSNGFIGYNRGMSLCHECQGKPSSDTKWKVEFVLVVEFEDSWDLQRTLREREREREREWEREGREKNKDREMNNSIDQ